MQGNSGVRPLFPGSAPPGAPRVREGAEARGGRAVRCRLLLGGRDLLCRGAEAQGGPAGREPGKEYFSVSHALLRLSWARPNRRQRGLGPCWPACWGQSRVRMESGSKSQPSLTAASAGIFPLSGSLNYWEILPLSKPAGFSINPPHLPTRTIVIRLYVKGTWLTASVTTLVSVVCFA